MTTKRLLSYRLSMFCFLFALLHYGYVDASSLTNSNNLLSPYGGFELGIPNIETYCYPRYATGNKNQCKKPVLVNGASMGGHVAFKLAGRKMGGYLLVFEPLNMEAGRPYGIEFLAKATVPSTIRVEISANGKRIKIQRLTIQAGLHKYQVNFLADKNDARNKQVIHTIRFNIRTAKNMLLDQIEINKKEAKKNNGRENGLSISIEGGVGIYQQETNNKFTLYYTVDRSAWLDLSISDPVSKKTIYTLREKIQRSQPPTVTTRSIPIVSKEPGYFNIRAELSSDSGEVLAHKQRGYVILARNNRPMNSNRRFGLSVEEHGYVTKSNAFLPPESIYKLAHDMGAGSLRIFSLAFPDLVSKDGKHFNFAQLSAALDLAKKYDLEPLIMLGENRLERLPNWLTLNEPVTKFDFDIAEGISVKRVKRSVLRSIGDAYFNTAAYQRYLDALFSSFRGRIHYYSFWNEPAYKFRYSNLVTLLKMTHDRLALMDKSAKLAGFSSTTRGDVGRGHDLDAVPSFLEKMEEGGNLKYIDILSYHSAHAFRFNSRNYNELNYETGFAKRILKSIRKYGTNLPLWDTERGVAWSSRREDAIDYRSGKLHKQASSTLGWLSPAMELPAIYASEFGNGVKRVFWFYLDSTSAFPITMAKRSRSMFGPKMEPTPQIAVYAAMTRMLGDIPFKEKRTDNNNNRMYIFGNDNGWVGLVHNWKLNNSMIKIKEDCSNLKTYDVMGRQVNGKLKRLPEGCGVATGNWPVYVKYAHS